MSKIRPIEILLIETIIYIIMWMTNDYLATMISLIFGCIFLLILIISVIVEMIERSRVPRWYFSFMLMSVIAPLLAAVIYITINGGNLEWMQQ